MFFQLMFIFCIDCTYLSVNRINAIGENLNLSSQLWSELQCVSPIIYRFVCIQYHVILSSEGGHDIKTTFSTENDLHTSMYIYELPHGKTNNLLRQKQRRRSASQLPRS